MSMFRFVSTELGHATVLELSWANEKEKGGIVHFNLGFRMYNVQMDSIGVIALFAFHSRWFLSGFIAG